MISRPMTLLLTPLMLACGGNSLPVTDSQIDQGIADTGMDQRPTAPGDSRVGDAIPASHERLRLSHVCPPAAIARDTPYAISVKYTVPCLGERNSPICQITVDGTTIRAGLYLEKKKVGCDGTNFSTHEVTCDLPALAAGDYSFLDDDCVGGTPVLLHVGEVAAGEPTCQDAPCS